MGLGREQRVYVRLFSGCMREGEVHGDVRVQAMCVCVCVYMDGDMCGVGGHVRELLAWVLGLCGRATVVVACVHGEATAIPARG